MSGGILGVAGDILSVAFLCFILSLAIQLYCAFSRRSTRLPTPLPATISTQPPQQPAAACKQLYLLRFQRSASCPVLSTIAPNLPPPNKLSSAYHVNPMACSLASDASPMACTVASQAHTADLAELMKLESGEEHDVDVENFICVPPPRLLFTIKEESATEQCNVASVEEDATEQSNMASVTGTQVPAKCADPLAKNKCAHAPANGSAMCAHALAAGLLSQVSSASSEGGVSFWSTSPCPSSPTVSYLSASSSPFPTTSPPRSSFWAQTSTLPCAKARFSNATN